MRMTATCPRGTAESPVAMSKAECRELRPPSIASGLLLLGALLLSACGKSAEERRTDLVRCSAYIQAFQIASFTNKVTIGFLTAGTKLSVGHQS